MKKSLQSICGYYPEEAHRAAAAREIAAAEQSVAERVVNEIFMLYPFEKNHAFAQY